MSSMENMIKLVVQQVREYPLEQFSYFVGLCALYGAVAYIFQAIITLYKLYMGNIPLLVPSISRHLPAVMRGNPGELFDLVMPDLKASAGLIGWLSPVGKPFVVIQDEKVMEQVLVKNANKLTKWHAFGVLELFRRTNLEHSEAAWKVVHKVASRFSVNNSEVQTKLQVMLSQYSAGCATLARDGRDFAEYTKLFYWDLVLLMVCGEADGDKELSALYKEAWTACIDALGSPLAHTCWFFTYLPLPVVWRYRTLTSRLRSIILSKIRARNAPAWTVMGMVRDQMAEADQLEIAMEFMFTGASSVTSTLIWMMHHISQDASLQRDMRQEASAVQKVKEENTSEGRNGQAHAWLSGEQVMQCPTAVAALRETLRLYSPIHIGRLTLKEFDIKNTRGEKVTFPVGTDIMSNLWFMQRNEDNWEKPSQFDHKRFLDKPNNVQNYHPFSMGVRGCPGQRIAFTVIMMIAVNLTMIYDFEPLADAPEMPKFENNLMLPVTPLDIYIKFTPKKR